MLFLSEEEGEELFYKRGFEFKLPYPCLNDFETNFGNSCQSSNNNNNNNNNYGEVLPNNNNSIKASPSQPNSESSMILTEKPQNNTNTQAKRHAKATNSTPSSLLATHAHSNNSSQAPKSKSNKYSKNQLIQQRAQQHAQQQFHQQHNQLFTNQFGENILQNSTSQAYHANESSNNLALNQNSAYKFNSNYHLNSPHLEHHTLQHNSNVSATIDNRLNYFNQNIVKSELVDEPNAYDSKIKFSISTNPDISSVASTSSSSLSSSSSSSSIPTETSISINISNSAYHYGNYFNGFNQSTYGYSNCINESQNKFYAASSSSTSPFYATNTTSMQNQNAPQNSAYNFYNHHLNQNYSDNNNETNNLHSNSSCSSTSSISSTNSLSGNSNKNERFANNGLAGIAAVGVLWPKSVDSSTIHSEHDISSQHYNNFNHTGYGASADSSQFLLNNQVNPSTHYSDLFNCANNAASIAAAKYSCAASVTSSSLNNAYCQYPFAIDDFNSSVSQI